MQMTALSVWQPFAWALCAGIKPVENREWKIWGARLHRWTLIHSGAKKPDPLTLEWVEDEARAAGIPLPEIARRPANGLVGAVKFVDDVDEATAIARLDTSGAWTNGPRCWVVGESVLFDAIIPCRGYPSFFPVFWNALADDERQPLISAEDADHIRDQLLAHLERKAAATASRGAP